MSEYQELEKAYKYAESLNTTDELYESSWTVVKALLQAYNDSCTDWEDEMVFEELVDFFGTPHNRIQYDIEILMDVAHNCSDDWNDVQWAEYQAELTELRDKL